MRKAPEVDAVAALIAAAEIRGVVDEAQASALRTIAAELDGQPALEREPPGQPTERRRPFNPIMIAYAAGALLVVFALGWFLAERWRELGTAGVLAVSVGYAIAFAATATALARRGFSVASGLTATLATAVTPIWTFAILRLAGEWPMVTWTDPLSSYQPWVASRWIILELATIGVALVAVRRVRFFTIALPIAVGVAAFLVHLGQALGDPETSWYVGPFYLCVVGTVMLAIAYEVDRRQPRAEDYALWFYIAAILALLVGYVQVWNRIGLWRHALPLVAVALVLAAVYLKRRVLLVAAGLAAFGYLGYLALDVFDDVVALPVALAGLGLLVIAATVWMQRRFPVLAARVSDDASSSRKALPGGRISTIGPIAIALTALVFARSEALERTRDRDWQQRFYRRRAQRELTTPRPSATSPVTDSLPRPADPLRK